MIMIKWAFHDSAHYIISSICWICMWHDKCQSRYVSNARYTCIYAYYTYQWLLPYLTKPSFLISSWLPLLSGSTETTDIKPFTSMSSHTHTSSLSWQILFSKTPLSHTYRWAVWPNIFSVHQPTGVSGLFWEKIPTLALLKCLMRFWK